MSINNSYWFTIGRDGKAVCSHELKPNVNINKIKKELFGNIKQCLAWKQISDESFEHAVVNVKKDDNGQIIAFDIELDYWKKGANRNNRLDLLCLKIDESDFDRDDVTAKQVELMEGLKATVTKLFVKKVGSKPIKYKSKEIDLRGRRPESVVLKEKAKLHPSPSLTKQKKYGLYPLCMKDYPKELSSQEGYGFHDTKDAYTGYTLNGDIGFCIKGKTVIIFDVENGHVIKKDTAAITHKIEWITWAHVNKLINGNPPNPNRRITNTNLTIPPTFNSPKIEMKSINLTNNPLQEERQAMRNLDEIINWKATNDDSSANVNNSGNLSQSSSGVSQNSSSSSTSTISIPQNLHAFEINSSSAKKSASSGYYIDINFDNYDQYVSDCEYSSTDEEESGNELTSSGSYSYNSSSNNDDDYSTTYSTTNSSSLFSYESDDDQEYQRSQRFANPLSSSLGSSTSSPKPRKLIRSNVKVSSTPTSPLLSDRLEKTPNGKASSSSTSSATSSSSNPPSPKPPRKLIRSHSRTSSAPPSPILLDKKTPNDDGQTTVTVSSNVVPSQLPASSSLSKTATFSRRTSTPSALQRTSETPRISTPSSLLLAKKDSSPLTIAEPEAPVTSGTNEPVSPKEFEKGDKNS